MFLQFNLLTGKAIVIEPEEWLTKVDCLSLFQPPGDGLELFEPWPQIPL